MLAPDTIGWETLHAAAPAGEWLADLECKLYARYDFDDSWTVGGSGRPAFVVGMWADGEEAQPLRERIELRQTLREQGFSCWDEPGTRGWIAFAKPLPLAELVARVDLEGQEHAVRLYCARVLDELLGMRGS